MEERIQKLEQRVNFLEISLFQALQALDRNTKVDQEQTELIRKIVGLLEEDRTAIKTLAGIKV